MYQLDANLCILASTLIVNCNFCVRFTFQQFFGKIIKALWMKTEEQERESLILVSFWGGAYEQNTWPANKQHGEMG